MLDTVEDGDGVPSVLRRFSELLGVRGVLLLPDLALGLRGRAILRP